ncbi:uncharacterized protein LOC110018177 [Phalaenopsis equestris]|uniref:uncharacterized protein LOC110018177 n=1 Tax=Phalaenopsis equestris TaxID=78828 RepID=UPI0009E600B0|nr:uncharacterized protein LOC110018177 [Phalaenopsis equestris]
MDASDVLSINRQVTQSPKGKEKMGDSATEEGAVCGICFSDGGLTLRGRIDSCDHYFCFVCIMEWAKVESRCPLCKQRFHFIHRPEVSGLLLSQSVLEIPSRDQVYHPLGNESSALSDPYAQANCKVCHGSNDDELLLLCDLCDSAFHTYCADLGYTVPEGDWYCHDCTILREEHAKIDGDADDRDQDQSTRLLDQQQTVSIFDIVVDESSNLEQQCFHNRTETRSSTNMQRNSQDIMLHIDEPDSSYSPSQGTDLNLQLRGVGRRARTYQPSCNLQRRVQDLRNNWTALQSGSLAFSSTLDSNGDAVSGAESSTSRPNPAPSQRSESSNLINNEQSTDSSSSRKMPLVNDLQDINKAWKMMQIAKKQKLLMADSSLNSHRFNKSLKSVNSISASKGAVSHPLNLLIPKNKMAADEVVGCSSSGTYKQVRNNVMHERHKFTGFSQKFSDTDFPIKSRYDSKSAIKSYNEMQLDSIKTNRALTTDFAGIIKEASPVWPSSKFHETYCSSLSSATCEAARKSLGPSCNKESPQDGNEVATGHNNRCSSKGHEISNNKAKFEIQSIVKLYLKQLSKGECLGTEKFKEIARSSTHSILAACGFEHSKSCARPFSNQVCRHTSQIQQLHGSTLLPGSCRECFHSFVKYVVKFILLEK